MAAIFFDTSALVRRYVASEPGAARVRTLCQRANGHSLLLSRITPLEAASAFNRRLRSGSITALGAERLWRRFRLHRRSQYRIIVPDEPVFDRAEQLLFRYSLRAYDALQIASALRVAQLLAVPSHELWLCTADRMQAQAAAAEDLHVEFIA